MAVFIDVLAMQWALYDKATSVSTKSINKQSGQMRELESVPARTNVRGIEVEEVLPHDPSGANEDSKKKMFSKILDGNYGMPKITEAEIEEGNNSSEEDWKDVGEITQPH